MMPEIAKEKKTKEDVIDAFKVAAPCPFGTATANSAEQYSSWIRRYTTAATRRRGRALSCAGGLPGV